MSIMNHSIPPHQTPHLMLESVLNEGKSWLVRLLICPASPQGFHSGPPSLFPSLPSHKPPQSSQQQLHHSSKHPSPSPTPQMALYVRRRTKVPCLDIPPSTPRCPYPTGSHCSGWSGRWCMSPSQRTGRSANQFPECPPAYSQKRKGRSWEGENSRERRSRSSGRSIPWKWVLDP